MTSYINTAKKTLKAAILGLNELHDSLDSSFDKAIDILYKTKGKIVVSGVGKSGHIGNKIASTLASTGTPAFFIHPTEAIHGDLGMIDPKDCVIMISNSGNSQEILGIVNYCLKHNIAIIAITNNPVSDLARTSTVLLQTPKSPEACPFNKAPTTSTTLALALGDCLAMSLMEKRGFSSDNFKELHPAGAIGKSLQKVADIMHTHEQIPVVDTGTNMQNAILVMTSKRLGCLAVLNKEGVMIGIITDGDLRKNMNKDLLELTVNDIMQPNFKFISPNKCAAEAFTLMHKNKITNLFVLQPDGKPMGVLHIHDLADLR